MERNSSVLATLGNYPEEYPTEFIEPQDDIEITDCNHPIKLIYELIRHNCITIREGKEYYQKLIASYKQLETPTPDSDQTTAIPERMEQIYLSRRVKSKTVPLSKHKLSYNDIDDHLTLLLLKRLTELNLSLTITCDPTDLTNLLSHYSLSETPFEQHPEQEKSKQARQSIRNHILLYYLPNFSPETQAQLPPALQSCSTLRLRKLIQTAETPQSKQMWLAIWKIRTNFLQQQNQTTKQEEAFLALITGLEKSGSEDLQSLINAFIQTYIEEDSDSPFLDPDRNFVISQNLREENENIQKRVLHKKKTILAIQAIVETTLLTINIIIRANALLRGERITEQQYNGLHYKLEQWQENPETIQPKDSLAIAVQPSWGKKSLGKSLVIAGAITAIAVIIIISAGTVTLPFIAALASCIPIMVGGYRCQKPSSNSNISKFVSQFYGIAQNKKLDFPPPSDPDAPLISTPDDFEDFTPTIT